MLTQNEKRELKALASVEKTKYQIGKNEITDTVLILLDRALTARELIKVDVLKGASKLVMELAIDLSIKLHAEIVQVVGRVIILFRRNKENPKIKFSKK